MPSDAVFKHSKTHESATERFESWWQKHEADLVVRCVCKKCNNEWMDQLDKQADRLITPVVQKQRVSLAGFTDQALLAAWVYKAAILGDQAKPGPGIPAADHRYFYDHWQPPRGCFIWVAGLRELPGHYEAWVTTKNLRGDTSDGRTDTGYYATMVVNHFVAQMVVLPFREIAIPNRATNPQVLRQVWPPTYDTTQWPPPAALRRADLPTLAEAFSDLSGTLNVSTENG
jgi:hypothetical protein